MTGAVKALQALVRLIWCPSVDCRPKEGSGSSRDSRKHRSGLHAGARRSSAGVLWP